jgi:hypothetical protein
MDQAQSRQILRDDFLRKLSNYSQCIMPYLRNVQEKYTLSYYLVENDEVDLKAYCTHEYDSAMQAKSILEKSRM